MRNFLNEQEQEPDREAEGAAGDADLVGAGQHPAPEPYAFSFSVDDTESGALTSREERQDASGEIVGKIKIIN